MGSKIADIVNGVYNLGKGEIAIIRKGTLRIYRANPKLIAKKMEKWDSIEKTLDWLKDKQAGQTVCILNDGTYYSDNLIIKVADKKAKLYTAENITKDTEGLLL